jgi:hypothetical protein
MTRKPNECDQTLTRRTSPHHRASRWWIGLLALVLVGLGGCEDVNPDDPSTINNQPGQTGGPDAGPTAPSDPCGGEQICVLSDEPETSGPRVPYSTNSDYVTVRTGSGYRPIFMKGVNLGVGVPGTRAGHLAATREQYAKWFDQMTDMGVNTLRIYTLHYPRFYEALAEHNRENPDNPLYILHGIWLHEEFEGLDLLEDGFRNNIREIVDCTHGNCHINHRYGKAYGTYETDISQWIMAWIIGREVNPEEIELTNEHMDGQTSWEGAHVRVTDAQPSEVWWAQQVDYLIDYELNGGENSSGYNQTRPISVSSWPTLDPLNHPTETEDFSSEDINSFDMLALEAKDAPGGFFATFHAYPYYPDYIVDDPDYRQSADAQGPNSYLGYLTDLKSHYADMPLYIGETGVSSSWGSAHWGYENMDHGGHTEVEQGEVGARLFRTVHDTNCAGGALFAWIDEWWKPTWISDPRGSDAERRPFWHNVTAAEQNFGLIGFDVAEPAWEDGVTTEGSGFVESATVIHDVAYFHVRLQTSGRLSDNQKLLIGFDTYGSEASGQFDEELGESTLPVFGALGEESRKVIDVSVPAEGPTTQNRNEFALMIDGTNSANMMVTTAYDSFRIWYGARFADGQLFQSTQTDGEPWKLVRWLNSQEHGVKDEQGNPDSELWFEETVHEIGRLTIRRADQQATSHDAVVVHDDRIDIRIPWTLLNVTDPSKLKVLHASPNAIRKKSPQHAETRGIAISVADESSVLFETERYRWEPWGAHEDINDIYGYPVDEETGTIDWIEYERDKPALSIFGDALKELPYWMD